MGSYSRKRYATESASFPKSANSAPGSYSYATFADLPASGSTPGNTAFVVATNKLYIWNGVGWYLIATVTNASPTAITGVSDTYSLAADGTATTITAVSTDPEGFALTWSYAVSSGSLGSTATVSQADNVFTITPSTDTANAGSFSLTFSVTDGINGVVSAVSSFTLAFFVTNSEYTTLLAKATNTGSNQTFDDASTSNHTITASGNVTASTFSPHRHGGYAIDFDGTNDFLTVPDSTDFDIASGADFTLELWGFYPSFTTQSHIVDTRPSQGLYLSFSVGGGGTDDGKVKFYTNSGFRIITASTVPLNSWVHIALVRNSGTTKVYINGTADSNTYSDTHAYIAGDWYIGKRSPAIQAGSHMEGLFSDYRFVNGTAVYTSNFTPPTEPLTAITNTKLLLGNLPYLKDQSTSNHTITIGGNASLEPKSVFDNAAYSEADHGASAYFDGTGDYLDVGSSGIANFGTGDFTIEFWINSTDPNALASGASNIINPISSTGSGYWGLMFQNGKLRWNNSYNVANLWEVNASTTILNGSFNHIAVVRNSGAFSIYFNGVSQSAASGTFTDTTNYSGDTGVRIGSGNANDFVGTLSDLRIVSSAVYTSNFTPPTLPLTAITNTKLLLNPETSISDLSQSSAITCVGNAATDATVVKFSGTKSIALDGTGDYLQTTLLENIGTSQFTIECWVRMSTVGGPEGVFHLGASAFPSNIDGLGIFTRSSTYSYNWGFFCNGTQVNSSTAPSAGVWYHLALVRDSNNLVTMYLDGNSLVTSTQSGSIAGDILTIGGYYNSSYTWNGNIQDFRITKGLARYTTNFTPPTAELQG